MVTRNEFRNQVFARDNDLCVICHAPAVDAHHILERRLWDNGGYILDNGVSVCEVHHLAAESTELSPEKLREAAGITRIVLPEHLYTDAAYTKWGDTILLDGTRLPGELYWDESVQKITASFKYLYRERIRYPRTLHVPYSPEPSKNDRVLANMNSFEGQEVVVTEKMDGENTTIYPDGYCHARSPESKSHPTRDRVKALAAQIGPELPRGWRLCGENLWATHSIRYNELPSHFLGFSIWNEVSECLSWDETTEWFALLGVVPVPVLYRGIYNEGYLQQMYERKTDERQHYGCADEIEGWVIRLANQFPVRAFRTSTAKFVRAGHVQTAKHWFHGQQIQRNGIVTL